MMLGIETVHYPASRHAGSTAQKPLGREQQNARARARAACETRDCAGAKRECEA